MTDADKAFENALNIYAKYFTREEFLELYHLGERDLEAYRAICATFDKYKDGACARLFVAYSSLLKSQGRYIPFIREENQE